MNFETKMGHRRRRRRVKRKREIVPSKLARSSSERAAKSRDPVLSAIIIYSVLVPPSPFLPPPSPLLSDVRHTPLTWKSFSSPPNRTPPLSFSLFPFALSRFYRIINASRPGEQGNIFVPRDLFCLARDRHVVPSHSKQSLIIMFHAFPPLRTELFLIVRELCHFAERSEGR